MEKIIFMINCQMIVSVFFGTLCIMKGNNSILGGNFVVAFDENMKCLFSDVGVIQQLEDTIIITTKDRIFTFGVYYKAF